MSLFAKRVGKTEAFVLVLVLMVAIYAFFCAEAHCFKAVSLCLACIASVGAFWVLDRWLRVRHENAVARFIFPVALVLAGVVSALFMPAGSIPDELYHYYHSYEYASALMGLDTHAIRAEDVSAFVTNGGFLTTSIGVDGWNYVKEHICDEVTTGVVSIESLTAVNPQALSASANVSLSSELPQLRLFSAAGIALGRIIGLNHVAVFYLGRLFNLLWGSALVVFAVRLAPIGKNIMMVAALFPMTIQLIGSYSYDCGTIGFAFLCIALALKVAFGKEGPSKKTLIAFLVVAALMVPCKPVYVSLPLVALFAPDGRFSTKRKAWAFRLAVVLVPVVAVMLTRMGDVTGVVAGDASDGVAYFSATSFWADPVGCFVMLVNTVEVYGSFWLQGISGDSLGWFQVNTSYPDYVSFFLLLGLCLASICSHDDDYVLPSIARCGFGVFFLISAAGIVLSMWLAWTSADSKIIEGVQGRYFIPVLPVLMLALRPKGMRADYSFAFPLVIGTYAVTLSGLAYISIRCLGV